MDTTRRPLVVVLSDPGKSKQLRMSGVVGAGSATVTDADLRSASREEQRIFAELSRQRFVTVVATGIGRLDKTHTVAFDVPAITTLGKPQRKRPTAPPKSRAKQSKYRATRVPQNRRRKGESGTYPQDEGPRLESPGSRHVPACG